MSEQAVQMEEESFFDKYFPFGSGNATDGKSTAPSSTAAEEEEPRKWQRKGDAGRGQGPGKGGHGNWARDNSTSKRERDASSWFDKDHKSGKDELEQEIKELKEQIFQLQRLALRQEDLIAAIRPEMLRHLRPHRRGGINRPGHLQGPSRAAGIAGIQSQRHQGSHARGSPSMSVHGAEGPTYAADQR